MEIVFFVALFSQTLVGCWVYHRYIKQLINDLQDARARILILENLMKDVPMLNDELPDESVYGELPKEKISDIEKLFPTTYDNDWDDLTEIKTRATAKEF